MRLRIVVDSDGIIKIARAGLLEVMVEAWECLIPQAVYAETVERGLRMAYPDASEIQASLHPSMIYTSRRHARATAILRKAQGLGPGEREALHLYFTSRADTILTDDAAFLILSASRRICSNSPTSGRIPSRWIAPRLCASCCMRGRLAMSSICFMPAGSACPGLENS